MKKLVLFLALILFPTIIFAQDVPTKQDFQKQLETVFWETNYCNQRMIVLQIIEKELREAIKKLEETEKKTNEKQDK